MTYVEINNVYKTLGPDTVMSNISFSANKGEIVALVGENGSGKTLLLKALCGILIPDQGTVKVGDRYIGLEIDFPPSLGFLIETPALLPQFSGRKNLELIASIRSKVSKEDIVRQILRVGLDPTNKKPCRTYSLGMKQRLAIALACMEEPELLVLDEPTNALDEDGVRVLKSILEEERQRGACIVLTSHDGSFIRDIADRCLHLHQGKIVGENL